MNKKCAILILAGGLGTRLLPLTKDYPKSYLPLYICDDDKIVRMTDWIVDFGKNLGIPTYINVDYKKDKLEYIKGVKIIETNSTDLMKCLSYCFKKIKEDKFDYYMMFACDFLVPTNVILKSLNMIDEETDTVSLCTTNNKYTGVSLMIDKNNNITYDNGKIVDDLTFCINKIDRGIKAFSNKNNKDIKKMWEFLYPKGNPNDFKKAKFLFSNVNHIDIGTPNTYYEVLMKLNNSRLDKNNNLIFPGAKINKNSKGVIALPKSDSSSVILNNCIVPENKIIISDDSVLKISNIKTNYFGNINIEDYI